MSELINQDISKQRLWIMERKRGYRQEFMVNYNNWKTYVFSVQKSSYTSEENFLPGLEVWAL